MARAEKAPFAPKGEYAPGAEVIWEEGGEVRVGQVWAAAPAESGHPAYWVVPFEPYGSEYAVKLAKGRKGGGYINRNPWGSGGQRIAEGELVVCQVYFQAYVEEGVAA